MTENSFIRDSVCKWRILEFLIERGFSEISVMELLPANAPSLLQTLSCHFPVVGLARSPESGSVQTAKTAKKVLLVL